MQQGLGAIRPKDGGSEATGGQRSAPAAPDGTLQASAGRGDVTGAGDVSAAAAASAGADGARGDHTGAGPERDGAGPRTVPPAHLEAPVEAGAQAGTGGDAPQGEDTAGSAGEEGGGPPLAPPAPPEGPAAGTGPTAPVPALEPATASSLWATAVPPAAPEQAEWERAGYRPQIHYANAPLGPETVHCIDSAWVDIPEACRMAPVPPLDPGGTAGIQSPAGHELQYYIGPTQCRTFRNLNANKCKVVIGVDMPQFRHGSLAEAYLATIGDTAKYCYLHIIGLPANVRAEAPTVRDDWLLRLQLAEDRSGWQTACQHLAAVYVQCQEFAKLGGCISAMTDPGWYQWYIGTPPNWHTVGGKTSFSKLDMERRGVDQGNECYYHFHAEAMQLAFPGKQGLVPAQDASANTIRAVGNVVETILGLCTALVNDCIILSAPKRFNAFLSPDE